MFPPPDLKIKSMASEKAAIKAAAKEAKKSLKDAKKKRKVEDIVGKSLLHSLL